VVAQHQIHQYVNNHVEWNSLTSSLAAEVKT